LFLLLLSVGWRITPDTPTEDVLPEVTRGSEECAAPEHVDTKAETNKQKTVNRHARELKKN
jgi:hypothetical protein